MTDVRRALELLEPGQRRQLAIVVGAMLLTAVLHAGGVVSIMPFIGLVSDPGIIHRYEWMAAAYARSGAASPGQFLVIVGVLTVLLLALTNIFAAVTRWITLRFVWDVHDRLSQRLLHRYLTEPYAFFLGRNTAELGKTLLGDVRSVVDNVLLPMMDVLARAITACVIVLLLIIVDPMLAVLSAGTLGGAYGLIYLGIRRTQSELGQRRHVAFGERFLITSEAFAGIKDVKVTGSEQYFLARFKDASRRYSKAITAHSVISELPRFALETIAFGGVVATIVYLLATRESLTSVLPVLALYALAGYRLIPALQTIFGSLAVIRFYLPSLGTLHEDLIGDGQSLVLRARGDAVGAAVSTAVSHALPFERDIRFQSVSFRYPDAPLMALQDVSLTIPSRHTIGLVGATGSGKTTVVDLVVGLFTPTSGSILIDGAPLAATDIAVWRRRIGYVAQSIVLNDTTIAQNIAFGVPEDQIDLQAVERAARAAHLHDLIATLPEGYRTTVGERGIRLSGGERQRVAIARALYRDPDVLVLDEATSALDTGTEVAVMQAIAGLSGRKTIILIAHRLTTVRGCDVIYVLDHGRLVASGTFPELAATHVAFGAVAGGSLESTGPPQR